MAKMTFMNEKRQTEIVEAVKVAADLTANGMDPTEALVKAAGDISANENILQRMVEAYNTAATLAHMKTAEDKAASFPLADFDKAKKALFPEGSEAKVAVMKKQASLYPLEIPDLRMEKVAFWGDVGAKYEVRSGEHKGKKGILIEYTSVSTNEDSMDGKTRIHKSSDECTAKLKTEGGELSFTKPDEELQRDYGDNGPKCEVAKGASEKTACGGCAIGGGFYGSVGDEYKIKAGEHEGSRGTIKSSKRTRRESTVLEGTTKTNKSSEENEITLELEGGETWVCKDPTQIERYYPEDKKASEKTAKAISPMSFKVPVGTPIPRDFESLQDHALDQCGFWVKRSQEERLEYEKHRHMAADAMHKIARAFRSPERPDWTRFEGELLAVHGDEAKPYIDAIWDSGRLGSVKCARAEGPLEAPFINDSTELHKTFKVFKMASEIAAEHKIEQGQMEKNAAEDRLEVFKAAGFSGNLADYSVLSDSMRSLMGGVKEQSVPAKPGRADVNPNVGLEAELQKARLQAIIRDMMQEDEVIAQHASKDPARVLQAVQEVSSLSPKILDMPTVLQAGVRKHLEMGAMDPFEMKAFQSLGHPKAEQPPVK